MSQNRKIKRVHWIVVNVYPTEIEVGLLGVQGKSHIEWDLLIYIPRNWGEEVYYRGRFTE